MAKQSKPAYRSNRRSGGGGFGKILLGIVIGAVLTTAAIAAYFYLGNPPVAVNDHAALWEPLVMNVPVHARARAKAKTAPFPASEDAFEAAAKTYSVQCAHCHGAPGHDASIGSTMLPRAPQFFSLRDRKTIATQSPGEIYYQTAFGVRHSGMPAYNHALTDTQLWQLSLLLHAANDELPDPVRTMLTANNPAPQPTVVLP